MSRAQLHATKYHEHITLTLNKVSRLRSMINNNNIIIIIVSKCTHLVQIITIHAIIMNIHAEYTKHSREVNYTTGIAEFNAESSKYQREAATRTLAKTEKPSCSSMHDKSCLQQHSTDIR